MGEASDELKDQAREMVGDAQHRGAQALHATVEAVQGEAQNQGLAGGEFVEKVKHVAGEAMGAAKRAAKEEGLDTQSLKEKGQAVASTATEHAKQEAMHHTEEMQHK